MAARNYDHYPIRRPFFAVLFKARERMKRGGGGIAPTQFPRHVFVASTSDRRHLLLPPSLPLVSRGCKGGTFDRAADPPRVPSSPCARAPREHFSIPRNFTIGIFPTRYGRVRAREKHLYINLKIMTSAPCPQPARRTTPSGEATGGGICLPTRNGEITAGRPLDARTHIHTRDHDLERARRDAHSRRPIKAGIN